MKLFDLAGSCRRFNASTQTLQAAVFGFSKKDYMKNIIRYNHIFPILKFYVFHSREKEFFSVGDLVKQIMKIRKMKTHFILKKSMLRYNKNWCKTDLKFLV